MKNKSNKKIILSLGIFLLFLFGVFRFFFWVDTKYESRLVAENRKTKRFSAEDIGKIRQGDIILRRGYGFFSDLIANKLNDSVFDVTHSGILYLKGKHWWVIHSLSSEVSDYDGVQEQPLHVFLENSMPEKILVVRPKDTNENQGIQIVEQAKYYLQKRVPFDRFGKIDDSSEMYCTELIWQILESDLKFFLLPQADKPRRDLFYSMKATYSKKYFDIIVNKYPSNQKSDFSEIKYTKK